MSEPTESSTTQVADSERDPQGGQTDVKFAIVLGNNLHEKCMI